MVKPNIIIADDHPAMRLGIKYHLTNLDLVGDIYEAETGQGVMNLLAANHVHVVLMDMRMPQMDGKDTTTAIRRLHPTVKIYIISLFEEEALITNFIKAGISGYILKNDGNLEEALTKATRGDSYYSKRIEPYYIKTMQKDFQSKPVKLTPREEKLLPLIAQGLNSHEIAEALSLSKFTVESYRKELLAKFDLSNSTALIDFAHRTGLI